MPLFSVARVALAVVWIWAGIGKAADPAAAARAVRAFRVLPEFAVHPVAYTLPYLEFVFAAALILGVRTKVVAAASGALLAVFAGGIALAGMRGLSINCGCFGGGGDVADGATRYLSEILRDLALLAASLFVVAVGPGSFSFDRASWLLYPRVATRGHGTHARGRAERQRAAAAHRSRIVTSVAAFTALTVVVAGAGITAGRNHPAVAAAIPAHVTTDHGFIVGVETAPVTIDVYEDFQCPACARFVAVSGDAIDQYESSGQAKVVYHIMSFLGPESVRAANAAALAQDRGKFTELYRYLYAHQPAEHTGGYTNDMLIAAGAAVGITDADYSAGIADVRYETWVTGTDEAASQAGVVETPTVKINGTVVTDPSPANLQAAIDALR